MDKLESIPGFKTAIPREEFFDIVNGNGIAVIGQSGNMVPADKKLYALLSLIHISFIWGRRLRRKR